MTQFSSHGKNANWGEYLLLGNSHWKNANCSHGKNVVCTCLKDTQNPLPDFQNIIVGHIFFDFSSFLYACYLLAVTMFTTHTFFRVHCIFPVWIAQVQVFPLLFICFIHVHNTFFFRVNCIFSVQVLPPGKTWCVCKGLFALKKRNSHGGNVGWTCLKDIIAGWGNTRS